MIGNAVEAYGCDVSGEGVTTTPPNTHVYENITSGAAGSYDDIMQCKVTVAVAISFLGAMFQVNANTCNDICFIYLLK